FLYQVGRFHFMEMITRIQVEHPVTEMVTGLDLVKMQLDLAMGGGLPEQPQIATAGHAIECRINAEDSAWRPSPGEVRRYRSPGGPGIRVDTHLYEGYRVPHEYDSLIGKIISHGRNRDEAVARMMRALDEMDIRGVSTNIEMHKRVLGHERFRQLRFNTRSLDNQDFS
ncbi:MAG: acetyl-CoA carboxylase biotin carboxylase subunit, partial [Pseudomonadales bacterium]|nr:acetyl-CoA carboxylase biotin carboxylase subunit [Pseudomonadales bacterium]